MAIAPLGSPINYQQQVMQPFQAALGGLQTGVELAGIQSRAEQARIAAEQQRAYQAEVTRLAGMANPGFADYQRLVLAAPAERQAGILKMFETQSKEAQENSLRLGGQVLAAVNANDLDTAQSILRTQAEGLRNAGNTQQADAFDGFANLVQANPILARDTIGTMLASMPGGKAIFDALNVQAEIRAKEELTPAQVALKRAQAEELRVKADVARRLTPVQIEEIKARTAELRARAAEAGTKLSSDSEKLQIAATTESIKAANTADKFDQLADGLKTAGSGGVGNWFSTTGPGQLVEKIFGFSSASDLQREFVRLRNEQVVKNLPPGAASDSDIQLFRAGFPSDTASFETMARFARGVAKVQRAVARSEEAKADWVSAFNGLGPAKASTIIGGVDVMSGTTFLKFQRDLANQIGQELEAPASGAPAAPSQPAAPAGAAPRPRTGRAPGESGRRGAVPPQGPGVFDYNEVFEVTR